jgi:hypothetical protein
VVAMSYMMQLGMLPFDEISFSKEPNVEVVILRVIGFALLIIVGFDPTIVNIGVGVMHARFFIKVAILLKTKSKSIYKQWTFIQTKESKLFTISWPFDEN